ncbi:hypothetical protein EES37_20525 [Streptomyces sp. ADI91-18]|nr:hypothetical protein EES37_20525 [Streptomyces sp. ADI91-18]
MAVCAHSTRNRESPWPPAGRPSWSGEKARSARLSTDATGAPSASAISSRTAFFPARESRTRRVSAPVEWTATPDQENGSCPWPVSSTSEPRLMACRAASRRAGWIVNCAASGAVSLPRVTSANTSSPWRQAARRPWNTGPYPKPESARPSYRPSTGTGSAPAGGQAARSNAAGSGAPSVRVAVAFRTQGSSPSARSSREWKATDRRPDASGAATVIWSSTPPSSGSTSGAARVSSSTRSQPTCSPARRASSTNAVPGSRTEPMTVWSPSHGWVAADSRPVRSRPSASARLTEAPSRGWSADRRPAVVTSPPRVPASSQ